MSIRLAVEEYLASKSSLRMKTLKWYRYHLERFVDWCDTQKISSLSELTPQLVQQALNSWETTSNTYSKHGYVQVVKGFLNWCSSDEYFEVSQRLVKRIALPRIEVSEVEIFTKGDIERLLRACKLMKPYPLRAEALVHILLDTGVRASELCWDGERPEEITGLRTENVFLGRGDDSYIRVVGKGSGAGKPRTVGMGAETTRAMLRYKNRERGESECPFFFLSRRDEPLSVRMLQQFMSDLGDVAGVPDCHPHRFRHTFAVNCLLNGVSDLILMQLLGHTSLEATKVYVRAMSQLQARQSAPSVVDRMRRPPKKWER